MLQERDTIIMYIITTTLYILLLVAFIIIILFFYQRKQIAHQKRIELLKSDFDKTLLSTQLEIQEQTFQNISREIHDNIGLTLTLVKLQLHSIQWNFLAQTKMQVFSSIELISKVVEDLRSISQSLNTGFIEQLGLIKAVEMEIERVSKLGLFTICYEVTGSSIYMSSDKEVFIFRIIQEVLNNSIKHAQATSLKVHLHYMDDHVQVVLSDNGIGFTQTDENLKARKGTGLMNITKRAELMNGSCEINSKPGKGTSVKVLVPY